MSRMTRQIKGPEKEVRAERLPPPVAGKAVVDSTPVPPPGRAYKTTSSTERMWKLRQRLKDDKAKYQENLERERERARRHRNKMKAAETESPDALEERRRKDAERQRRCRERKKQQSCSNSVTFVSNRSLMKKGRKPTEIAIVVVKG